MIRPILTNYKVYNALPPVTAEHIRSTSCAMMCGAHESSFISMALKVTARGRALYGCRYRTACSHILEKKRRSSSALRATTIICRTRELRKGGGIYE